jgi:hypothetical protein
MDPKLPPGPSGPPGPAAALPSDVLLQEDVEVSEALRARILRQIDQVMVKGRQPLAEGTLAVKPRKKGVLFPVLTNVVTAMVVAAGIFGIAYAFRGGQNPAALSSTGFQSAEGRLLETFRRQSESRLQAQESQTLEAQERLRAAEGSLERRLRQREADLRQAMDEELAGERDRLQARGVAVAEVEARLAALEAERQAALAAELGRLRAGLKLQELADARTEELLLTDRIRAGFAQVLGRLRSQDVSGARASLASLKTLLDDPAMQEHAGLRESLPMDRLLAEALAELLALRERQEAVPAAAAAGAPASEVAPAETADLRAELAGAKAALAERDRQVQGLQKDLRNRTAAADAEATRARLQLNAAAAKAEVATQQARSAEEKSGRQGREEAFKEVIAFLDYLKGDPAKKQQLTAQLAAKARQDPLYATVAREIQILAAGVGVGGSASPFRLLGTVSSAAPGRVVVEPLVDLEVRAGARVQIRRASGLASEVLVARGTVHQAGAGGITVLLDSAGKVGQVPQVLDAVYVETGE